MLAEILRTSECKQVEPRVRADPAKGLDSPGAGEAVMQPKEELRTRLHVHLT